MTRPADLARLPPCPVGHANCLSPGQTPQTDSPVSCGFVCWLLRCFGISPTFSVPFAFASDRPTRHGVATFRHNLGQGTTSPSVLGLGAPRPPERTARNPWLSRTSGMPHDSSPTRPPATIASSGGQPVYRLAPGDQLSPPPSKARKITKKSPKNFDSSLDAPPPD